MKPVSDEGLTLDDVQTKWVEKTLNAMTIEERIGQILIPNCSGDYSQFDQVARILEEIPLGGVFTFGATAEKHRAKLREFQAMSKVPLVIAADLESGAGMIVHGATAFPEPLATAAADDEDLAYKMGKASARQGRSLGIHWTYAPVVDVNVNPENPIANTRSFGDDPDRVARLASAVMRGMQDHGLAACVKHFPGDGVDDLDQHVVTSVNSLSMDQWKNMSGRAFAALFDAGVWSVMIGHIALPAWEPERDYRGSYRPASVSSRIVTDLLRKEMGFQGLIVTDDMNMGGVCGYMNRRDRTVGCIKAGCDMLLFPRLPRDYGYLEEAVHSGELSEERVTDAARHVLEFKARLGLHTGELAAPDPTPYELQEIADASRVMAEKALVQVRDFGKRIPLSLKEGAKVLTLTLSFDELDLPEVDEELKKRGYEVDHLRNPTDMFLCEKVDTYDAVFLNFYFKASWAISSIRCTGPFNRIFLGDLWDHPGLVCTSFGTPYHLRMFRTLPNLINVHSSGPDSQKAAVKAWFGEIPMTGKSPVGNLVRAPAPH